MCPKAHQYVGYTIEATIRVHSISFSKVAMEASYRAHFVSYRAQIDNRNFSNEGTHIWRYALWLVFVI